MLHLGFGNIISAKDVVLIADYKTTTYSNVTNEFLKTAEEEGFITDLSNGKVKSFIVTNETIYYSMISSNTLTKRLNFSYDINCN